MPLASGGQSLCFLNGSGSKEDNQEGALKAGTRTALLAVGDSLQTPGTGLHVNFAGSFTCT